MSSGQTYTAYHKEYYHKNKERINERRKEYNRMSAKRWYHENREKILEKNRLKRIEAQKNAIFSQTS